jgi:hypothetical protein
MTPFDAVAESRGTLPGGGPLGKRPVPRTARSRHVPCPERHSDDDVCGRDPAELDPDWHRRPWGCLANDLSALAVLSTHVTRLVVVT